jgi:hypothetical protein
MTGMPILKNRKKALNQIRERPSGPPRFTSLQIRRSETADSAMSARWIRESTGIPTLFNVVPLPNIHFHSECNDDFSSILNFETNDMRNTSRYVNDSSLSSADNQRVFSRMRPERIKPLGGAGPKPRYGS